MKVALLMVALCLALKAKAEEDVIVDDEINAVVISAEEPSSRQGRELDDAQVVAQPYGSHCERSNGAQGYCQAYSHCYPFYQLSQTTPAWAYGSKDSCQYSDEDSGQAAYGHCCDQSVQLKAWGPLAASSPLMAAQLMQQNYWTRQHFGGAPWRPMQQHTRWGPAAAPIRRWGQQAVRRPQYPGLGGIFGAQYPAGVSPIQGGIVGAYPPPQQPMFPQGGGIPGIYPPMGGMRPPQGVYPQRPQGVYPQRPQVPQPQPPPVVIAPTTTTRRTTTTTRRTTTQRPVVGGGGGASDASVIGAGAAQESEDPASAGGAEDYSKCGIPNRKIVYQDGQDKEALDRLSPELRIRGGKNADMNEWPWIAGIYKNGKQFCGGSLVDATHILTAAHCVDHMRPSDIPSLLVKLGDHDINTETETKTTNVRVAQIIKHKGFSQQTLHNDVAILRLSTPVKFRKNVKPVCMKSSGASVRKDTLATVVGWGLMSDVGPRPPSLQEITFKVWDNSECSTIYGSTAPGGITDHMLCAGQQGQDSCMGDSGGPMTTLVGDHYEQIGIVSWGIACGKREFPGVYTRVGKMRPWIDRALAKY